MNTFKQQVKYKSNSLNNMYKDEIRKYKEKHNMRINKEDLSGYKHLNSDNSNRQSSEDISD